MKNPITGAAGNDEEFVWQVPETFNFATDVVVRFAADAEKLALIWCDDGGRERRFSFRDVARRSCQLANLLTDQGVRPGDRVVVMLPRIPEWQLTMLACHRMGAVPVPCITMLTARDIAYRVRHAEARAVVTTSDEVEKFAGLSELETRIVVDVGQTVDGWIPFSAIDEMSTAFDAATVAADDPAVLYYTSGSTGDPKGVSHASRALWAWGYAGSHWLGLDGESIMWCTADTGWSKAGTSVLYGPWTQGSAVLFYNGAFDESTRFKLLERYRVSCFCAAATELRRLILEDASAYDLSALARTVSAGESVNPEIISRWAEMTGTTILDGYGQTEILMTITNRPGHPVLPGSMGRPLPGVEACVRTSGGEFRQVDAEGDILIRLPNPQHMLGYRNAPDKTAATQTKDPDGGAWFITGDSARIDQEGNYFYTGRTDDIISSAGYRIGPQEVENALLEHDAVRECAVVGIADPARGEIVAASVVLTTGFEPSDALVEALQAHCKKTTAPYKYPRRIRFVEDLPKTVTGKIRRNLLRERG